MFFAFPVLSVHVSDYIWLSTMFFFLRYSLCMFLNIFDIWRCDLSPGIACVCFWLYLTCDDVRCPPGVVSIYFWLRIWHLKMFVVPSVLFAYVSDDTWHLEMFSVPRYCLCMSLITFGGLWKYSTEYGSFWYLYEPWSPYIMPLPTSLSGVVVVCVPWK